MWPTTAMPALIGPHGITAMPNVQFIGKAGYDRDNIAASSSRLVNCYREPLTTGKFTLKSVLGMDPFAELAGLFVRDMQTISGVLIVACGGAVWRITPDGAVSRLFDIVDSPETSISSVLGKITVAAGGKYYVFNGATATEYDNGPFAQVGSVDHLNHYAVMTEKDGSRLQWSKLADPSDLPGLNFATADGRDDKIVRGIVLGSYWWVLKQTSHEIYYNAGGIDGAFVRMPGAVRDVGLAGFHLITKIPGSLSGAAFLVGNNGRAYVIGGTEAQRVSTPGVETAIAQCRPISCIAWEDEGRTFAAIIFRDCPAWVYDVTSQEWHERAEGLSFAPWNVAKAAKMGSEWFIGRNTGAISALRRISRDGDVPLLREAVSDTMRLDRPTIIGGVEIFPRQGFAEGQIRLSLSRDGGMTWGLDKPRDLGGIGQYGKCIKWRNLGQYRNATLRLRWNAPADLNIATEVSISL